MSKISLILLTLTDLFSCKVKQEEGVIEVSKVESLPELQLSSTTIYTTAKDTEQRLEQSGKILASFSVDHAKQYRIPMINKALAKAGGPLLTYSSPWSPSAFTKSNNNMLQGGKLLPEYYGTWALPK